jgi:hypothetical protein
MKKVIFVLGLCLALFGKTSAQEGSWWYEYPYSVPLECNGVFVEMLEGTITLHWVIVYDNHDETQYKAHRKIQGTLLGQLSGEEYKYTWVDNRDNVERDDRIVKIMGSNGTKVIFKAHLFYNVPGSYTVDYIKCDLE